MREWLRDNSVLVAVTESVTSGRFPGKFSGSFGSGLGISFEVFEAAWEVETPVTFSTASGLAGCEDTSGTCESLGFRVSSSRDPFSAFFSA